MLSRSHLPLGLVGLALGLISIGCADIPQRRVHDRLLASPPPVPPAPQAVQPAPATTAMQPDPKAGAQLSAPAPAPPVATLVNGTPPPASGAAPSSGAPDQRQVLQGLQRRAVERYITMPSYIARLRRREQVNGKDGPEEIIALQFRQQPWSVHMKWIGPEANGREVIFVKGRYENKLHTLLAPTDPHFPLGGNVVSLALDSPLIRARSRHPITGTGIGNLIDRFGELVAGAEARTGPIAASLKALGPVKRADYEGNLECVEQTIPPRLEALLPAGGRRWWFFDAQSGLPALLITHDDADHEVEYYCYDRLQYPVNLDDVDFDPTRLGKARR